MTIAEKLQIKPGSTVATIGLPDGVALELPGDVASTADVIGADAVIAFVSTADRLDAVAGPAITAAKEDRLAWIAYPKAGALGTDLNRDRLAALMIERGTRPVRQIAVDDVWSALRFRPA